MSPFDGLLDQLEQNKTLPDPEMAFLICSDQPDLAESLFTRARRVASQHFGRRIFPRGLIEFTNYCRNDCYYCGIRRSNRRAERYRLTKDEILSCCDQGHRLGFRTFVLQGGEDPFYSTTFLSDLVRSIKGNYPDCAVTLSIGEKEFEEYRRLREAGADRYLLRHETADAFHYRELHPAVQTAANRLRCLNDLKTLGFQVGSGFMVGSPGQTTACLLKDLHLLKELEPQMIGIGPFIPHQDTPFADEKPGCVDRTLRLIAILRLMMPRALIPATTALGTLDPQGREKGILAGANVVMPNLSPVDVRKKYALYDHKICTGEEAAECWQCLQTRLNGIGYELVVDRGDYNPA
ncbi:MAG: [FeFe] hydrogenase H-cluster radical SAM maturase HydE [Clostridiaceae bacterium]|nr:[FeFe] hydrogenase H-cluster radical SAM maturase HydE [Clostridiaceae bacterium]